MREADSAVLFTSASAPAAVGKGSPSPTCGSSSQRRPGVSSCSPACWERLLQTVLTFHQGVNKPGEAVFSSHTPRGYYCDSASHEPTQGKGKAPDPRTLQGHWVAIRKYLVQQTNKVGDIKGKDGPLFRWLLYTWGPLHLQELQELRDIAARTIPPKRAVKKQDKQNDKIPPPSPTRFEDAGTSTSSGSGPVQPNAPRGAPQLNIGLPCDGLDCPLRGQRPAWRHHCVTCARAGLRNYNLCPHCHSTLVLSHLVKTRPAFHPSGHLFTHIYNYTPKTACPLHYYPHVPLEQLLSRLSLTTLSFSASGVSSASSHFQHLFRAMYKFGVGINECCSLVSHEQWRSFQAQCIPNVDLSMFYHHAREHEYLVFLFWANSNMLDVQRVAGSNDSDRTNCTSLAVRFLETSGITRLGELARTDARFQQLTHRLQKDIFHVHRLRVDVEHFDFAFIRSLTLELSILCPLFRRPDFADIFQLITDSHFRHEYWKHWPRLEHATRERIDRQPAEWRLELLMVQVIRRCGLPSIDLTGRPVADPSQIIAQYMRQLFAITQQYTRMCLWRRCRLRLAELCYELVTILLPSSQQPRVAVDKLSLEHLEIVGFLMTMYNTLRPRDNPSLIFEWDESTVTKVMDSVDSSVDRLCLLIRVLLDTKRYDAQPYPPRDHSAHSRSHYQRRLRLALVRLVSLYLFLARSLPDRGHYGAPEFHNAHEASTVDEFGVFSTSAACTQHRIDQRLSDIFDLEQQCELVEVPAYQDKFAPNSSATGEFIYVVGEDREDCNVMLGKQGATFEYAQLSIVLHDLVKERLAGVGLSSCHILRFNPSRSPSTDELERYLHTAIYFKTRTRKAVQRRYQPYSHTTGEQQREAPLTLSSPTDTSAILTMSPVADALSPIISNAVLSLCSPVPLSLSSSSVPGSGFRLSPLFSDSDLEFDSLLCNTMSPTGLS